MTDGQSPLIDFSTRPASTVWEQIVCPAAPNLIFWCWFKPVNFPHGVVVLFPQEIDRSQIPNLTMRAILQAIGINFQQVTSWALNGMTFEAAQGSNPLLDQPLPPAIPGGDPQVYIACHVPVAPMMPVAPQMMQPEANMAMPAFGTTRALSQGINRGPSAIEMEWLEGMHAEWNSSVMIEADLLRQRKKIVDVSARLKSLNRDLNTDERTYSSSQDKKDWQDARRWLRDCGTKLARCLKDYDIGFTSSAGQRTWFEETYEQFVEKKLPFDGMEQAFRDYQIYHKSLQNLNSSMKSAVQYAMQNGERKAQRVINTIQSKVREGNAKKSFMGVISGTQ
ncbi:MAG TPA: hypothetical protein DD473_14695 [Planctomycetaceae bacterium]|nr:hypothetical protein [Planctomycetaceae bacterium]